jgi:hypothetical protein
MLAPEPSITRSLSLILQRWIMVGIFLQDLPFDLDIACPISIPWHASVELEIPTSGSPIHADEAEEQDEVYNYLRRRYWETLYLPEVGSSTAD